MPNRESKLFEIGFIAPRLFANEDEYQARWEFSNKAYDEVESILLKLPQKDLERLNELIDWRKSARQIATHVTDKRMYKAKITERYNKSKHHNRMAFYPR